jgi:hypothetical protein
MPKGPPGPNKPTNHIQNKHLTTLQLQTRAPLLVCKLIQNGTH